MRMLISNEYVFLHAEPFNKKQLWKMFFLLQIQHEFLADCVENRRDF